MNETPFKTYLFEYPYQGDRWAFEIKAASPEDAEARFKALGWGEFKGELVHTFKVPAGGLLLRFWQWLRGAA